MSHSIVEKNKTIENISVKLGRQFGSITSRLLKLGIDIYAVNTETYNAGDKYDDTSTGDLKKVIADGENTGKSCIGCRDMIPAKRLAALPETNLCVKCASFMPQQKRTVKEIWGSREDWMRDRRSWKTNSL